MQDPRNIINTLILDNPSRVRDLNPGIPKDEVGMLATRLWCWIDTVLNMKIVTTSVFVFWVVRRVDCG
jgi:hypothetical protein